MCLSVYYRGYTLGISNTRGGFADSSEGVGLFPHSLYRGPFCSGFLCPFSAVSLRSRLFPELKSMPDYRGFLTFLTFRTVNSSSVRRCSDSQLYNIKRDQAAGTWGMSRDEQYVHHRSLTERYTSRGTH